MADFTQFFAFDDTTAQKSYLVGVKWHTLNAENIKKPSIYAGFRTLKKIWSCWDGNLRTEIIQIGREIEEIKLV